MVAMNLSLMRTILLGLQLSLAWCSMFATGQQAYVVTPLATAKQTIPNIPTDQSMERIEGLV
jgi:excinuclease UvrABC ATPase subunit